MCRTKPWPCWSKHFWHRLSLHAFRPIYTTKLSIGGMCRRTESYLTQAGLHTTLPSSFPSTGMSTWILYLISHGLLSKIGTESVKKMVSPTTVRIKTLQQPWYPPNLKKIILRLISKIPIDFPESLDCVLNRSPFSSKCFSLFSPIRKGWPG